MYALPKALERYRGLTINGQVAYADHVVPVPAEAVDETFVKNVGQLITRIASQMPAKRLPSPRECRFCEITPADCPERAEAISIGEGRTDDF